MKADNILHGVAMALCALVMAVIFINCARTYHIYNIVDSGSTLTQTIRVDAVVEKKVDVATDVSDIGGIMP